MQLSTTARNARLDAVTSTVGNAGLLRIYSGSAPANCAAAATGVLLSAHTLASPFAPGASSATLSPTLPSDATAAASGTAGYWRVYKSDGTTCVLQGTLGTSGTELVLNTTAIVAGGPVSITAWSFSESGA